VKPAAAVLTAYLPSRPVTGRQRGRYGVSGCVPQSPLNSLMLGPAASPLRPPRPVRRQPRSVQPRRFENRDHGLGRNRSHLRRPQRPSIPRAPRTQAGRARNLRRRVDSRRETAAVDELRRNAHLRRTCNRWQTTANRIGAEAARSIETVAVSCDRLPFRAHGKDGVDGSSPSEGFRFLPA
jgi:hypothetical protein